MDTVEWFEGGRLVKQFSIIDFPVRFVNNLFRTKSSTLGKKPCVLSTPPWGYWVFRPSSWFGLEAHDEDFGQTLGHYGVGGGVPVSFLFRAFQSRGHLQSLPRLQLDHFMEELRIRPSIAEQPFIVRTRIRSGVTIFEYVNEYSFRVEEYEPEMPLILPVPERWYGAGP